MPELSHDHRGRTLAVILAAGRGKRMAGDGPKVLRPFRGRPLIAGALEAAQGLCDDVTVVVGYGGGAVAAALPEGVRVALQPEQRGTGDAVRCALEAITDVEGANVLVLPGDHPLVTPRSLLAIAEVRRLSDAAVALATVKLPDFEGLRAQFASCGRIVRGADDSVARIVERKDATDEEAAITEVNVSYYCFRGAWLRANIAALKADNAAGEYYVTDLIAAAAKQGEKVVAVPLEDFREGLGVNTAEQLAAAEAC